MSASVPTHRLYRLILGVHPMRADFLSNMARGRLLPEDPEQARLWDGLSMYETPVQARATGTRFPEGLAITRDGRRAGRRAIPP